jgi:endonuclease/exonuclease/phosphatase family metal-dependent hydrolase
VIVASYNIKWFGQTAHDLGKLAQVIQNFDVCGIIEVKDENDLAGLVDSLEQLTGRDWGYVFGMRTHRPNGSYHEAYAAVWRKDRVALGDGIVSNTWDIGEAYRNDPYLVSFKRGNFDFYLLLIHTRWSSDEDGTRENEVQTLVDQIDRLRSILDERDLILAGDFNYSGTHEAMTGMADEVGLDQIDPNAETTFKSNYSGYASSYDHIYISTQDTEEFISSNCAVLDATELVYGGTDKDKMKKSKSELSDHLPVWAAFDVSQPDDD